MSFKIDQKGIIRNAMAIPQSILVIDDEKDVGVVISTAAEAIGLDCTATTNATTFLKALTPETSLILLDLRMPEMDGVELLRLLAQRECKVGIVLMSGVDNRVLEAAKQLAQTHGLNIIGHLNKPFGLPELQSMLARHTVPKVFCDSAIKSRDAIPDEELRNAIKTDQFVLHYQPQIDVATGNVIGVEALVRWQHPKRGLIFPFDIIGRAETLGLIGELGWITFSHGIREVGQFADDNGTVPSLSLNVSVHSLYDLTFPDTFMALLNQHGVHAENVILEITESGLIRELASTLDVLTRLRMKQVQLSIDDFGTGYSMMQQLRNIPATELKIDKTFVQNIYVNDADRVMVQKTIEIGHELGMKVIAEGVETTEQLDFIRSKGCDVAQGYLFSRPLPAKDMVNWLKKYRSKNQATKQRTGKKPPMKSKIHTLTSKVLHVTHVDGQDLVEYALVVALIAFAATTGMKSLAGKINTAFTTIGTTLSSYTP
jgi:EAL domain-containing protein (putative c-di-GMP-specific phosphodiesterase class I)/CheY-like chemotaxis protein/Flp pilus assembly pilin Flp